MWTGIAATAVMVVAIKINPGMYERKYLILWVNNVGFRCINVEGVEWAESGKVQIESSSKDSVIRLASIRFRRLSTCQE